MKTYGLFYREGGVEYQYRRREETWVQGPGRKGKEAPSAAAQAQARARFLNQRRPTGMPKLYVGVVRTNSHTPGTPQALVPA